jgi:hypothetical protein
MVQGRFDAPERQSLTFCGAVRQVALAAQRNRQWVAGPDNSSARNLGFFGTASVQE